MQLIIWFSFLSHLSVTNELYTGNYSMPGDKQFLLF